MRYHQITQEERIAISTLRKEGLSASAVSNVLQAAGALSTLAVDETGQSAGTGKTVSGLEDQFNRQLHPLEIQRIKEKAAE